MATTYIPPMGALKPDVDLQEILEQSHELLERTKGDEDKADTIEDSCYYEGLAEAFAWIEEKLTGTNPLAEESQEKHGL